MPNLQTHHDQNAIHPSAHQAKRQPAHAATLDQQYRAIGISAVAAAARYPTEKRRSEYAPVYTREQD